jgi:hypothetical protein
MRLSSDRRLLLQLPCASPVGAAAWRLPVPNSAWQHLAVGQWEDEGWTLDCLGCRVCVHLPLCPPAPIYFGGNTTTRGMRKHEEPSAPPACPYSPAHAANRCSKRGQPPTRGPHAGNGPLGMSNQYSAAWALKGEGALASRVTVPPLAYAMFVSCGENVAGFRSESGNLLTLLSEPRQRGRHTVAQLVVLARRHRRA